VYYPKFIAFFQRYFSYTNTLGKIKKIKNANTEID
jgi:hypothetical protein